MHYLLAFDKFKDSMSADTACRIAAEVLGQQEAVTTETAPLTDGGEGFATILTEQVGGLLETVRVPGPRFKESEARIGFVDLEKLPAAARATLRLPDQGRLAVVEMAQASGLEMLKTEQRDPWHTSTVGTGKLIAYATSQGVDAILVGIGGSATSDLGLGTLAALGLHPVDAAGKAIENVTPQDWEQISGFSGEILEAVAGRELPPVRVACDVTNPLLGKQGSAAIYGPQKGLAAEDVSRFDSLAGEVADKLLEHFEQPQALKEEPGAGAAGGIGFGLRVALGAELVPGFELVAHWLGLEEKVAAAEHILTGEGKFDASSLAGKGPFAVLEMARKHGKAMTVLAGLVTDEAATRLNADFGARAHSIGDPAATLDENLLRGPDNLRKALNTHFEHGAL